MGKYDPLRGYLAGRVGDQVTLTFTDLENVVGRPLPGSARAHRAWWANDSKVQAQAWRAAGWRVLSVNLVTERVIFSRDVPGGPQPATQSGRIEQDGPVGQTVALSDEQRLVMQAIYDKFRDRGVWPTFISVDRSLRRTRGVSMATILKEIPESLLVSPRPGSLPASADDQLRLRIRGISACDGGSEDANRFLRLLRWFAQREVEFESESGGTDTSPRITSEEVREHLELDRGDDSSLRRLYAILQLESWGQGSSGEGPDGWYFFIGPDAWRFRSVETVEDFIAVREQWKREGLLILPEQLRFDATTLYSAGPSEAPRSPATRTESLYVSIQVIADIKAKGDTDRFDYAKLLGQIDELNDNYARGNGYAAHALLRAILDHIPPILDCPDFKAVANNYRWSRTDKSYVRRLLEFKLQADDALHRRISEKTDLLDLDDMPPRAYVNRLLQECTG